MLSGNAGKPRGGVVPESWVIPCRDVNILTAAAIHGHIEKKFPWGDQATEYASGAPAHFTSQWQVTIVLM